MHVMAQQADLRLPPSLAFGIHACEGSVLFEHMPLLSADMSTLREMTGATNWQGWGNASANEG